MASISATSPPVSLRSRVLLLEHPHRPVGQAVHGAAGDMGREMGLGRELGALVVGEVEGRGGVGLGQEPQGRGLAGTGKGHHAQRAAGIGTPGYHDGGLLRAGLQGGLQRHLGRWSQDRAVETDHQGEEVQPYCIRQWRCGEGRGGGGREPRTGYPRSFRRTGSRICAGEASRSGALHALERAGQTYHTSQRRAPPNSICRHAKSGYILRYALPIGEAYGPRAVQFCDLGRP
jgi:hypothetical protein